MLLPPLFYPQDLCSQRIKQQIIYFSGEGKFKNNVGKLHKTFFFAPIQKAFTLFSASSSWIETPSRTLTLGTQFSQGLTPPTSARKTCVTPWTSLRHASALLLLPTLQITCKITKEFLLLRQVFREICVVSEWMAFHVLNLNASSDIGA